MSTYNSSLNHIVFATKYRTPCLTDAAFREELYRCMGQICKNKNCFPIAINGIEDHVHILVSCHPAVAIADLVKSIKTVSNSIIKEKGWFPNFIGWQNGYGHFTYSMNLKKVLERYVQNQVKHHAKLDSKEELRRALVRHDVQYDPKYFE